MPDYSLGRAHGRIEIEYDGSGATKAERDLGKVAASSEAADKSLTNLGGTLRDSRGRFVTAAKAAEEAADAQEKLSDETQQTSEALKDAGTAADGYKRRLQDVKSASADADAAERRYKAALLDSRASLDDIKDATDDLTEKRKRHAQAIDAERSAHRALSDGMNVGQRAASLFASIIPSLNDGITRLSTVTQDAGDKSSGLASKIGTVANVVAFLGPQGRAAAAGLTLLANGMDEAGSSASGGSNAISEFVKGIASFEVEFGKISGLSLAVPSLGGLLGLGGAASIQGLVNVAGAVKELSGGIGLLPAVISGAAFSMGTLQLAFRGVGDALTDMMSDDPTKFLEDIKDMGPVAAASMLQIAQFRDQFKLAAAAPQESFFAGIADQIAPLIQTWLPAVAAGMAQVAGVFGQLASTVADLLMQPAAMGAFQQFVDNVSAGLTALQPAIAPLLEIFTQLTVVGSSTFGVIGEKIAEILGFFARLIDEAAASGELRTWILEAVNGFGQLVNIAYSVGSAFLNIMDVAEKFGGGGLLAWLAQLADQLNQWTQSTGGQEALTAFFSAIREATDAFTPMLGPLVEGIASIATAFTQLGIATAPGWQVFFDTFAATMQTLGTSIVGMGPAVNTFLTGMSQAFADLVATLGPQLPRIFQDLANAFVALLPQIPALAVVFVQLVEGVGPQLPKFFGAITDRIISLLPYLPTLIGFVRNFVSVLTWFIGAGTGVINWFTDFAGGVSDFVAKVPGALGGIGDAIGRFFAGLPQRALDAGKSLIGGLVQGIENGLGAVGGAARAVVNAIADFFQSSPAKVGPFSGAGYTLVRGQKMVTDMAAGMTSAQSVIESAAASTAQAASGALAGAGGAPTPGGRETSGSALLPDNIAAADTSILTAYLRHQFSDDRGLKGLAKDLGSILDVAKGGADLIMQNVMQPLFQGLSMLPGADAQAWRKMSPTGFAAQQQQESQRKSLEESKKQGPAWQDVLGPGASPGASTTPGLPGASVPLIQNPDGTWTSPDPAWAHLIARESSGVNQRQQITDVNSGGNEAEGLFQITPKTWAAHGGSEFAPNALAASVQQQAAIAARILQGNPSGSDWGAGLPGRESAEALLSGLTGPSPAGAKGPTWAQITGSPAPPVPPSVQPQGRYGLPEGTDTGGYGTGNAETFPPWVMALAEQFGVLPRTYSGHQESDRHEEGFAPNPNNENRGIDWSGSVENMQRLSDYLATVPGALEQVIWRNPNTGQTNTIAGGRPVSGYYPEGTLQGHENHVHTRQSAPIPMPGGAVLMPPQSGVGSSATSGLMLPSGNTIDQLLDTSQQNVSINDQLLQAYLQGNPALAQQINAAQMPGAADDTVMGTLGDIGKTITDLTAQDAVGNKNTIDALQSQQSTIAQQQGFTQAPNQLQQAQSIAGTASGVIGSLFKVAQSSLDALTATQDIADRLVYGIRNTDDINKLVDNVQKYITLAADIFAAAGSIASAAGSFGAPGAGAAGSALSLISSVLQGVNAAIDFGQQVYEITSGYVGQFMSVLTGLSGTPLMGNVGFLLNKNTGELQSYSHENPGAKNTHDVPSWMNSWYDYNGRGNPNPQVSQQLNIYAGPGQSPREMMNETMWMVNSSPSGAMAGSNF